MYTRFLNVEHHEKLILNFIKDVIVIELKIRSTFIIVLVSENAVRYRRCLRSVFSAHPHHKVVPAPADGGGSVNAW